MSLTPGDKLGPYEILAPIGAGGMGEVYRARDPRLNRDVAIKVSQERFSDRFEREARAVAALNHPNICTLHDVGPDYLVMEFIEGESPKGPLPLDEALRIARQIADALEAAHEKGIVHRDLKPANIKIKPDGTVKVLDFGLAKTVETASGDPASSPTMTISPTRAGMILGTAAYMSPEQARGKTVDKRADIWAFGVVLYELLTGRMLFQGEDLTETVASVVKEKADLSGVPERVRPLLEKCLEKDPRKRLRDIGDMGLLLDAAPAPQAGGTAGPRGYRWISWAVAGALAAALAALSAIHFRETPAQPAAVRFQVPAPEGGVFTQGFMALSPDGRQLAFLASGKGGLQLWVRGLDSLEARPLPGTEGGIFPFWSPDSRLVAFTSADRKLKKIEVSGGPAQTLCSLLDIPYSRPYAGDWTRDGAIFFGGPDGIYRVPQAGGQPVRVTQADAAHGELYNAYPQILADGRHFLYLNVFAASENNGIYLGSFDGKVKKRLAATTRGFRYAAPSEDGKPGHLLFLREETLMAQPFDPKTLEVAGDAFPIAERVSGAGPTYAAFTVSGDRALAYYSGGAAAGRRQLTWYDRTGKALAPLGERAAYNNVALSRDGARAAVTQDSQNGRSLNLWLIDVARGIPGRFTFEDSAADLDPVWSPDGSRVAFGSNREGRVYTLYVKSTGNAAKEERLQKAETGERPCDWSPDGRTLMYTRGSPGGGHYGLWSLSDMTGDPANRKASAYLDTKFNTTQCQFSPDGHWVAYSSDEAANGMEVYVQSFPAGSGTVRVSSGGGSQPRWRRNGKELFYMGPGGKLMAVDVKTAPAFQAGTPHALFDSHMWLPEAGGRLTATTMLIFRYDVTSDGQRFLVNTTQQTETPAAPPGITVVLNWTAGLKK